MASDSGADSQSGSGKHTMVGGEIGWKYATAPNDNKSKPQCNFCRKIIGGGGITRLKQHLVGGYPNVAKCPTCPKEIRDEVKAHLEGKSEKKKEKGRRDDEFNEFMFHREFNVLSDSDDDDIQYPQDIQTEAERNAYKAALHDSMRSEHERRELGGRGGLGRVGGSSRFPINIGSGSGSGSGASIPPKKKQKGMEAFLRRSSSGHYVPSKDPKQKTLKGMLGNMRERVGRAVTKLFVGEGIPANVAKGPFLQHAIDEIASAGGGVTAPTPYEIMNKYLPMEKEEIGEYIAELKKKWPEYGVTLMCDGWTSYTRKQIINFLVYCDGKTVFIRSVDASEHVKSHKYILKLLKDVIEEVGQENIVQIVTDNGSNFKKAGEMIMSSNRYGIFWTPCAAHCIDLILKDFGKRKTLMNVVDNAQSITTFIYNHSKVLALMRRMCGGDIVRPGITRFATNFIALQSMQQHKVGLKKMCCSGEWFEIPEVRTDQGRRAETLINNVNLWDDIARAIKIMEPVVSVLRIVDGDKKPTMGVVYEAMRVMKENVKENVGKCYKVWLGIIDERWSKMLSHPLHQAAYYLNLKYHYKHNLGTHPELLSALQVVVEKLVKSRDVQTNCMNEIKYFREALGSFGRMTAINGRNNTLPGEWWILYGLDAPNLRQVAVKVLSQTASAGGCERNWSTFNLIHSKRRNSLGVQKLHDLVYIHYNLRLKMKHAREGHDKQEYIDPIDLAYIFKIKDDDDDEEDVLQKWMDDNGAPVLDERGGRPNTQIASQMEADVEDYLARSGRHPDPAGGLESDSDDSSSRSKSKSKSGGSGGGVVAAAEDYMQDEGATSGGGAYNTGARFEGAHVGQEYTGYRTNIHGQFIPSPNRDPAAEQMDYCPYPSYPQSHPRGQGQDDTIMEDLISSVGSLSMDVGDSIFAGGATSSPFSGYGSQGQNDSYDVFPPGYGYNSGTYGVFPGNQQQYTNTSSQIGAGSGYGIFPDYYPAVPPSQPLQMASPPTAPAPSSSSRGSQVASSSRRPPRDSAASASSGDKYPRIGFLAHVTEHEYKEYLMDYKTMYSYMIWEDYVEYRDSIRSRYGGRNQTRYMDPPRNSWFG